MRRIFFLDYAQVSYGLKEEGGGTVPIFMSRLPVDRLFGHHMVASSKARHAASEWMPSFSSTKSNGSASEWMPFGELAQSSGSWCHGLLCAGITPLGGA